MTMARKSEYKTGINKAARVFTRLVEAVEDAGGGDDNFALIEFDEDLRRDLAARIMRDGRMFELLVDYCDGRGVKLVRFRELAFDHDVCNGEVLARAAELHCRRPEEVEVRKAVSRYTSDQLGEHPRVGLIGGCESHAGTLDRVCIMAHRSGVNRMTRMEGDFWPRSYLFVVVCE